MGYAHVLLDENDNVVIVSSEEALTVTETKLLMSIETYNEILEIAEEFEDSIKRAMQSNELNEDEDEERSTADIEGTLENQAQESLVLSHFKTCINM